MSSETGSHEGITPSPRGRKGTSKPLAGSATNHSEAAHEPVRQNSTSSDGHLDGVVPKAQISSSATKVFAPQSSASPSGGNDQSESQAEAETPYDSQNVASSSAVQSSVPEVEEAVRITLVERETLPFGRSPGHVPVRSGPTHTAPVQRNAASTSGGTLDDLQVTAQEYPWLYMSSTLDACFQNPEAPNTAGHLGAEEVLPRSLNSTAPEAGRLHFIDEKKSDKFMNTAPVVMQSFHAHGETCTRIEAEALELALRGSNMTDEDASLQVYHDMLENLEKLHAEALELELSIVELTSEPDGQDSGAVEVGETASARSQILGVVSACLPVIRARITNLSTAQELVDSALENLSISLRMESLGIE